MIATFLSAASAQESTLVTMPTLNNVLPCTDIAANCATNYYTIQKADQIALDTLVTSAKDLDTEATGTLTSVQSLRTQAQAVDDLVDPDNSRTNGGELRQLAAGRKLVGITPYMATLASKMVTSASKRVSDFGSIVTTLTNGMGAIGRNMADTKKQTDSAILLASAKAQAGISSLSASLKDVFQQADTKIKTEAKLFDYGQGSGPNSTTLSLQTSLNLLNNEYNSTLAKLSSFYSLMSSLPDDLKKYLIQSVNDVSNYQVTQDMYSNQLSLNKSSALSDEIVGKAAHLIAQIRGITTADKTSPYYTGSLTGYMEEGRRDLAASAAAANTTQQGSIDSMNSSIVSLARNLLVAFVPATNALTIDTAAIAESNTKFNSDTSSAIADANATVTQASSGFQTFKTNMESVWNTTGQILTGQTTTITASLLNQIGALLSQAGTEVTRLNALMQQSSQSTLDADAVRQAILAKSRSDVISMIGSNSAAMNASGKTITDFMNKSSSEVSNILRILKILTGDEIGNINATSMAALANVVNQVNVTQVGAQAILASLLSSVKGLVAADSTAMNSTFAALKSTSNSYATQTNNLIQSMNGVNLVEFGKFLSRVNSTKISLDSIVNVSRTLSNSVTNISAQSDINRNAITAALDIQWSAANTGLNTMWAKVDANYAQVKALVERSAGGFGANQYNLISLLSGLVNNATGKYSLAAGASELALESLTNVLNTNITLFIDQLAAADGQLTDVKNDIDLKARTLENLIQSSILNATNSAEQSVDALTANASIALNTALGKSGASITGNSAVQNFTSRILDLEGTLASLTQSINQLKTAQPDSLAAQAAALKTQFNKELTNLKSLILDLANDPNEEAFERKLASSFDGLTKLVQDISAANASGATYIADTLVRANQMIDDSNSTLTSNAATAKAAAVLLKQETQTRATRAVNDALDYMNTTFNAFGSLINETMESIAENKKSENLSLQLGLLGTQINTVGKSIANTSTADSVSADMNQLASAVSDDFNNVLSGSAASLTAAEAAAAAAQQASADQAAASAATVAAGLTGLASSELSTGTSVVSASAAADAGTSELSAQLNAISNSGANAVQITANDLARILARYRSDTGATKAALQTQVAASGKAELDLGSAMNIATKLQEGAKKLSEDSILNLSDLSNSVFTVNDALVNQVITDGVSQYDDLKKRVGVLKDDVAVYHDSNLGMVSSAESELVQTIASVADTQNSYAKSLSDIKGYVNGLVNGLRNRYDKIVSQNLIFRNTLETSAADDITALTAR